MKLPFSIFLLTLLFDVSFGHAAFFGIGGYAMGILASHAQSYIALTEWPFLIEGTKSMPVIWLVAVLASALAAIPIGIRIQIRVEPSNANSNPKTEKRNRTSA